MPTATYEQLLSDTRPARIVTEEDYAAASARFGALLALRRRTAAEEKLMGLLEVLLEDYDRRNALPPDEATPAARLRFVLEHSGKTAADLTAIFGQRSHVSEALNGKRSISTDQARRLGQLFRVRPGLFV